MALASVQWAQLSGRDFFRHSGASAVRAGRAFSLWALMCRRLCMTAAAVSAPRAATCDVVLARWVVPKKGVAAHGIRGGDGGGGGAGDTDDVPLKRTFVIVEGEPY